MAEFSNISIRKKLIIIQLATALMAVLICCGFFVYNDIKIYKDTSIKSKHSIAEIVGVNAASTLEFADQDAANSMLAKLKSNGSILNAIILDKDGKEFARYNKAGEPPFSFPRPNENEKEANSGFSQKFLVSYRIIDKDFLGTVMLHAELTGFKDIILNYLEIAALILIASLAAAFLISNLLQRTITSRLLSLVNSTKQVAETGNYSIRVYSGGQDEIGILSGAFNNMLNEIEKMQKYLNEANIELENRVKRRTSELETANHELEVKSDELTRSNLELGQYAYVASHDLQEPLRTISNYVGLLQEKYDGQTDEETQMYIKFVVRAANTMKTLINHLLDFSRIGRDVSYTTVDTDKILADLREEMQGTIRDSKARIIAPKLPVLTGNAIELKQLFQNLISNAIKFRKKDTDPVIVITTQERPNEWLFTIKDNGIGMEKKYQDKIFIIFQRLNNASEYPGTGIGLATCKKIVSLHNGNLWVESELGQGSTFYFTISKNLK